jgi:hypothetical protein
LESEIAQIRRRIEEECLALKLAMEGFAITASHQAITARYDQLGIYQTELEKMVGEQAGKTFVCEMYAHIIG